MGQAHALEGAPAVRAARVVTAHRQLEGAGFEVRRPIPSRALGEQFDPFLLLDHLGPVEFGPGEAAGAPWHPHRGFQTISYLLDGELEHKDSTGNAGTLRPGDFQLMTAGAGIVHDESPSEAMKRDGGRTEGFQIWVNLARAEKMTPPSYQDVEAARIPKVERDGFVAAVAAGDAFGAKGPVETATPIHFVDVQARAGATIEHAVPASWSAGVYVYRGEALVAPSGQRVAEGQFAAFAPTTTTTTTGDESTTVLRVDVPRGSSTRFLILAGRPLREPIARHGPFVMSTRAEVAQAFEDYEAGRLGTIPATFKSRTRHDDRFDPSKHSLVAASASSAAAGAAGEEL